MSGWEINQELQLKPSALRIFQEFLHKEPNSFDFLKNSTGICFQNRQFRVPNLSNMRIIEYEHHRICNRKNNFKKVVLSSHNISIYFIHIDIQLTIAWSRNSSNKWNTAVLKFQFTVLFATSIIIGFEPSPELAIGYGLWLKRQRLGSFQNKYISRFGSFFQYRHLF